MKMDELSTSGIRDHVLTFGIDAYPPIESSQTRTRLELQLSMVQALRDGARTLRMYVDGSRRIDSSARREPDPRT